MRDTHLVMMEKRIFDLEKNGGGVSLDYEELENKPKIDGTVLVGNKSFQDLGVASAIDLQQTADDLLDVDEKVDDVISSIGTVPEGTDVESQITEIKQDLISQSSRPTLKHSLLSNNQFFIDSIGKVNVITGYCNVASGSVSSGTELFELPIEPKRSCRFPMIVVRGNSTFNLMCYSGVNGIVHANHSFTFVSGDLLMLDLAYIS